MGWEDEIKFRYITREGDESTAYFNPITGEGTDKYSDVPVRLAQQPDESWLQVDDWEWRWNPVKEDFEKVEDQ